MPTLLFTDLDVLRLALTGGVVPPAVAALPAAAGQDDRGRIWLKPVAELPRETVAGLARLGVPLLGGRADVPLIPVACWGAVIPPRPADFPPPDDPTILIVLPTEQLPQIAGEIQRLRPDAGLSFRFADSGGVLLRVERCPVHTLRRSLAMFVPQSPKIWVQAGWSHPLADTIVPDDLMALVHADGTWSWLTDRAFNPELNHFPIESDRIWPGDAWAMPPIPLPLRLAASSSTEPAELWVIHERPLDQLTEMVRRSGQAFAEGFRAAVVEPEGRRIVLLRAEPVRGGPPPASVDGLGCRSVLKLPNLFVPCGSWLHPPLRRDVARRLLANDPRQVTVLLPIGDGRFVPLRVRESAFRPLVEMIDFQVEEPVHRIEAIAFHHRLDWAPMRVEEDVPRIRPEPAMPVTKRVHRPGWLTRLKLMVWPRPARKRRLEELRPDFDTPILKSLPTDYSILPTESTVRRSDLMEQRTTLEGQFLAALEATDPAQRQALLPDLAALNSQLGAFADAAACWLGALWQEPNPPRYWVWGWLQAERQLSRITVPEMELLALADATPSPNSLRVLAAAVVWWSTQGPAPSALLTRAARITQMLEAHEDWLPVRAAWLARLKLAELVGHDVLALARTRDRLLDRLHAEGLSLELDVPSFLRFAGRGAGERFQSVREWLVRMRDTVQRWLEMLTRQRPLDYVRRGMEGPDRDGAATRALADLILAGGLARLGEHHGARHLASTAAAALAALQDPTLEFLQRGFEYRLHQALTGQPAEGSLPEALFELLDFVDPTGGDAAVMARYRADCLRAVSRVLEPTERIAPFRVGEPAPFHREWELALAHLPPEASAAQAGMRIERVLNSPGASGEALLVMTTGLELAPRHGPGVARELLRRLVPLIDRPGNELRRLLLLARGLEVAATLQLPDAARPLRERLVRWFSMASFRFATLASRPRRSEPGEQRDLESLAGRVLWALTRLDLEPVAFETAAREWLTRGEPLAILRRHQPEPWPAVLRALLYLAGGSSPERHDTRAVEILDAARKALLYSDLPAVEKGPLACAYAAALGQAPSRMAQGRLEEMFRDLTGLYDVRQTNSHFALTPLCILDAVVTAVAGDDFALSPAARRWLDEDEFRVRQRMQRDLKQMIEASQRTD